MLFNCPKGWKIRNYLLTAQKQAEFGGPETKLFLIHFFLMIEEHIQLIVLENFPGFCTWNNVIFLSVIIRQY